MIRSEFEALVDATVGAVLAGYGFTLTRQPPGEVNERRPRAIYETTPEAFRRTLPKYAAGMDVSGVDCVDLTIEGNPRMPLLVELEGQELVRAPLDSLASDLAQVLAS